MSGRVNLISLTLSFIICCASFEAVHSAPFTNAPARRQKSPYPVVYKRFVRRRPPQHPDDLYTDEFVEIFHVRQRPPKFAFSEEDVDRLIRCDFDPTREECEKLNVPVVPMFPAEPPLRPPSKRMPTTSRQPAAKTPIEPMHPYVPAMYVPTVKPVMHDKRPVHTTRATTTITTTTEYLPLLPNIPFSSKEESTENDYETLHQPEHGDGEDDNETNNEINPEPAVAGDFENVAEQTTPEYDYNDEDDLDDAADENENYEDDYRK